MARARTYHHRRKKYQRVLVVKKATKHKAVDRATYFIAVVEPIMTIPQVYAIWSSRNATGVSISSWAGYWVFGLVWLWYGLVHKDKAILLYNGLYLILEFSIVVGALRFGGHW